MFVGFLLISFLGFGFCDDDWKPLEPFTQQIVDTIYSTHLTVQAKLEKLNTLALHFEFEPQRDLFYYRVFLFEFAMKRAVKADLEITDIVKQIQIAEFLYDIKEIDQQEMEQRISKALYEKKKEQRIAVVNVRDHVMMTDKTRIMQNAIESVPIPETVKLKLRDPEQMVEKVRAKMGWSDAELMD